MRKVAPIIVALGLSLCIGPLPQHGETANQNSAGNPSIAIPGPRGIVASDVNDSDEFLQPGDFEVSVGALRQRFTLK